jgi:hypothetical protein
MTNYGTTRVLELLKEAVTIGAHGEMWHHEHMMWAQTQGLQGHKRLNRLESGRDRAFYIRLQNYCIDLFAAIVRPDWAFSVAAPGTVKEYLENYLNWENHVYTRLGRIAEELDALGYPAEAELVRDGLPEKELERVRRWITEYDLALWDMSYILLDDKKLHKKIKKKE